MTSSCSCSSPPENTFPLSAVYGSAVTKWHGIFFALITPEETSRGLCWLTKENLQWKTFLTFLYLSYNLNSKFKFDFCHWFWCWLSNVIPDINDLFYVGTSKMLALFQTKQTGYSKTNRGCLPSTTNRPRNPISPSLQWRHNGRDCLLKRLFMRRSKETSKLRIASLCKGNSPVIGEFPAQRASNAENVSIWWRHHDIEMGHHATGWSITCAVSMCRYGVKYIFIFWCMVYSANWCTLK